MKLAIRGHDLGKMGQFDLTEEIKKYDLDGLQLVPYKTFADVGYSPAITLKRAKEIADGIKAAGKETYLLGAYFNPVHSDREKVNLGVATFKRYLELTKTFNTDVVASETGSFNDDKWTYNPANRTFEALTTVVETFSDLADHAKKVGAVVAMEGASGHCCYSVERLYQALSLIGDDRIKVVFDLYNYLDADNYRDYKSILKKGLKTFEGRIHCFHMKDFKVIDGKPVQCAIGEGLFDYDHFLREIRSYDENAVLVLEGTTGDAIAPSVALIRKKWGL
ncbi:MAG: sugar phosphate isomerase/epimerase [Clostridia bacterium]|nr:sugar phosphate isomerase/epimerase [Clostridia bacterium]